MTAAQPTEAAGRWRGVRRLLAVRLDNLGDVLMTTPALAALRETWPSAQLTLLGSPAAALLAGHLPMVDEVWTFSAPWMRNGLAADDPATLGSGEIALVDRLAAARFDAAVIFTVCTQSALPAALLCRLAGIPLRLAHCRENPYSLLTDWVPESDEIASNMRHEVQRQLALVAAVGASTADDRLRFAVHDVDRRRLADRLAANGICRGQPYAVLHPGATAPSRRWPAERFGEVAAALAAQRGCAAVFSGDAGDAALVEQARRGMQSSAGSTPLRPVSAGGTAIAAVSLAGELSLGEFAALVEGACVLIANNSAPAHLAAALGTPVVDLYALTNPQHTPWRVASRVLSHDVPCRWCLKSSCPLLHHDCLRRVEPQRAVDAAVALLDGAAADEPTAPAGAAPPAADAAPAPTRPLSTPARGALPAAASTPHLEPFA